MGFQNMIPECWLIVRPDCVGLAKLLTAITMAARSGVVRELLHVLIKSQGP